MRCGTGLKSERGSVMFYIFLAIALLAALTFFFTKDTRTNVGVQMSNKIAQELYVQSNLIRSAVVECTLSRPEGGGDMFPVGAVDGVIDTSDNPNTPYPLTPSGAVNNSLAPTSPVIAADDARNIACLIPAVAPATLATKQMVFQGVNAQARYLPPPPSGWPEWQYKNDATGVYISVVPPSTSTDTAAANALATKFNLTLCQATWSGSGTFKIWITKATCP